MIEKDNYIQFEILNKYNDIAHLSTKKPFDFNNKKIDSNKIESEYEELNNILNINPRKISISFQKHTNIVKVVTEDNLDEFFNPADGLITNLKNVALSIRTADCQGILIYDKEKKIIGNIHSGWRGTLGRIIVNAIELMKSTFNSDPKDLIVCFCPSILECCFEVDEDLALDFKKEFSDINIDNYIRKGDNNKYYIDTIGINNELLINLGLLKENIINSNICTKCNKDIYHSYRGEPDINGRNVSYIMLK
ncbi:MAG: peptidoglycan editing factor PgeF [Bacilli bacterium]|nr:peptidoglycan editing factor PgeF [Bacilli bacterium]